MRLFSAGGVAVGSLATSYIGVGLSQIRHADGGKTTTETAQQFVRTVIKNYIKKIMNSRKESLALIESNINKYGYHTTIVSSNTVPRYAYTIGLSEKFGFEFILAGAITFLKQDLHNIFNEVVRSLDTTINIEELVVKIDSLGDFSFSRVDDSWSNQMMLGVYDFYDSKKIIVYQIKPDKNHYTLDIPNMEKKRESHSEPLWQWLDRDWNLSASKDSSAITNLDSLRGVPITEVMRWEESEWEMFAGAGPEVAKEDVRVVPISTLLAIDSSLAEALNLEIGKGIWRENFDSKWKKWE